MQGRLRMSISKAEILGWTGFKADDVCRRREKQRLYNYKLKSN
jgi:hypothetical protein